MQSTKRLQSPGSALAEAGLAWGLRLWKQRWHRIFRVIQALKGEESCFLHVLWIYNWNLEVLFLTSQLK